MSITPLYASVLALLFVFLSIRVIGARRVSRVGVGDGGDRALMRRIRVHGNFAEYVPFAVVLMTLAELQRAPGWTIHLLGVLLLAGRLVHAYGVSREPEEFRFRVTGMAMTFTVLICGALLNLGATLGLFVR